MPHSDACFIYHFDRAGYYALFIRYVFEQQSICLARSACCPPCPFSTVASTLLRLTVAFQYQCGVTLAFSLKHQPYLQKTSVSWVPPENIAFFSPDGQQTVMRHKGILVLKDTKCLVACEAFRHKAA